MSTRVVMPPAAAARVAVQKPSQWVRPGSLTWTWVSTARLQDVVAEILQAGAGRHLGVVGEDGRDPAAGDRDRGGARSVGGEDTRRAHHQFSLGHPDPSRRTAVHFRVTVFTSA
jgi:hypothetical protein